MSKEKTTKALGPCFRCCQSNIILYGFPVLLLSIVNNRGCLEIKHEEMLVQNVLCRNGRVELVFLIGFLKDPEKLDTEKITENLKDHRWTNYSISLAKAGVKKFKESFKISEKVIIIQQPLKRLLPPVYLLS